MKKLRKNDKKNKAYPSLNRIVKAVEDFYSIREDQNNLLRELRALRIKRNERIKDFNIKYETLYFKVKQKEKKSDKCFRLHRLH